MKISIGITAGTLTEFKDWTSNKNCWEVSPDKYGKADRSSAELIMLCKALHLGGLMFTLDIHPTKDYTNSLLLTQQQKIHLQGESVWQDQIDSERFYISSPVIRKGEFEKGIYTVQTHPMMKLVTHGKSLANYKGISVTDWHQDWNLIRQLTKSIVKAPNLYSIHTMIADNSADFTLGEFNQNMTLKMGDITLHPIPNLKVSVPQSRHFAVRKGMNNSTEIFQAIKQGLAKMRALGMVSDMYKQAGLQNPTVAGWHSITFAED